MTVAMIVILQPLQLQKLQLQLLLRLIFVTGLFNVMGLFSLAIVKNFMSVVFFKLEGRSSRVDSLYLLVVICALLLTRVYAATLLMMHVI